MVQNLQEAGNTMINECYSFKHTHNYLKTHLCAQYILFMHTHHSLFQLFSETPFSGLNENVPYCSYLFDSICYLGELIKGLGGTALLKEVYSRSRF